MADSTENVRNTAIYINLTHVYAEGEKGCARLRLQEITQSNKAGKWIKTSEKMTNSQAQTPSFFHLTPFPCF